MSRTARIVRWLPPSQLKDRYLKSETVQEGRRWQLLWLIASRQTVTIAAETVGYCVRQAHRLLKRYNERGPTALQAGSRDVSHLRARALLTAAQQRELKRLIKTGRAPDGSLWTGPKVAAWIAQKTGRRNVAPQRGWDYLKKLGFSLRRPRPRHTAADPVEQQRFKKNSRVWRPRGRRKTPRRRSSSGPKTSTASG